MMVAVLQFLGKTLSTVWLFRCLSNDYCNFNKDLEECVNDVFLNHLPAILLLFIV